MKRYDLELTATGPVMEEREQGAFVHFSEVSGMADTVMKMGGRCTLLAYLLLEVEKIVPAIGVAIDDLPVVDAFLERIENALAGQELWHSSNDTLTMMMDELHDICVGLDAPGGAQNGAEAWEQVKGARDRVLASLNHGRPDTEWTDATTSPVADDYRELQEQHDQLQSKHKGALDLIERMVSYLGLAGDEPEKDSYNPMKAWMYDAITTMAGQRQKIPVTVTETIRTAPERIWLQVGDSQGDSDYQFPEHHDEVTWCSDSVIACEVPYVRADLVGKQPDAWLPIETAPRDGRKALVYRPLAENSGDERIAVKRLTGGRSNHCWDKTVPPGETPCNPTDGACHVTHWMPLPDDPVQLGGEPCAIASPSSSPA